jgi:hypothetical protein
VLTMLLLLQGFPDGTWPVSLHLVSVDQGDTVNVYQAWTWSVFAVTSAMIGAAASAAHVAAVVHCGCSALAPSCTHIH